MDLGNLLDSFDDSLFSQLTYDAFSSAEAEAAPAEVDSEDLIDGSLDDVLDELFAGIGAGAANQDLPSGTVLVYVF